MPEKINTAQLDDGILSANTAGRAKMADNFLSADATGRAKVATGFLTADLAGFEPCQDLGQLGVGYIRFDAATVAGDTISIGAPAETWTCAAAPATDWEYLVDLAAATCAASFAARVNANAGSAVRALVVGTNLDQVVLFAKLASAGNLALAESTAGTKTKVGAAAQVGSRAVADRTVCFGQYAVTAEDETTVAPGGLAGEVPLAVFDSTTEPHLGPVSYRDATGAEVSFTAGARPVLRLAQQGANQWALLAKSFGGGFGLVATNVCHFCVYFG